MMEKSSFDEPGGIYGIIARPPYFYRLDSPLIRSIAL